MEQLVMVPVQTISWRHCAARIKDTLTSIKKIVAMQHGLAFIDTVRYSPYVETYSCWCRKHVQAISGAQEIGKPLIFRGLPQKSYGSCRA
jgi:hypothetical protein